MACPLFGAMQLSKPVIIYCQLDPKTHILQGLYLNFKRFPLRKCIENLIYKITAILPCHQCFD